MGAQPAAPHAQVGERVCAAALRSDGSSRAAARIARTSAATASNSGPGAQGVITSS